MCGGDGFMLDVPNAADTGFIGAAAKCLQIVCLQDHHVTAVSIAVQKSFCRRSLCNRPDNLQKLVTDREHGVLQPERRNTRVRVGLAKPQDVREIGGRFLALSRGNHQLAQAHGLVSSGCRGVRHDEPSPVELSEHKCEQSMGRIARAL